MRRFKQMCVCLLIWFNQDLLLAETPPTIDRQLLQFNQASDSLSRGKAVLEVLKAVENDNTIRVNLPPDLSIAIKWHALCHRVSLVKSGDDFYQFPLGSFDEFFKSIAQVTGGQVPEWWRSATSSIWSESPNVADGFRFYYDIPKTHSTPWGFKVEADSKVSRNGSSIIVNGVGGDICLDDRTLKRVCGPLADRVIVSLRDDKHDIRALVAYSEVTSSFSIARLNINCVPFWISEGWGTGLENLGLLEGGTAYPRLSLSIVGGDITVYGIELGGIFIEQFRLKDGKRTFAFSSTSWYASKALE